MTRLHETTAWRIAVCALLLAASACERAATADGSADDAVAVVRAYYDAINSRDFVQAYTLWSGAGAATRQPYDSFRVRYIGTDSVLVRFGEPGPIEGAIGSRLIDIPVIIDARISDGTRQRFRAIYTLRRGVAGDIAERSWHIDAARIEPCPDYDCRMPSVNDDGT